MIKISHIATALLLASISVAHAETANQPVSQGAASVNKNLSKDPDNKGLQNASERLKENEAKVAAKRADADKKSDDAKLKRHKEEKHEKHEEHERMEKVNHDNIERPAKPERPAR
jgi:hypothetical protein